MLYLVLAAALQVAALPPLMSEDREVALARSAAPAELSGLADVYVLRRGGHVRAVRGTNGAACMVSRDHPESLYPICFDPEAARTILPVQIERQRLRERGVPEDSIDRMTELGFQDGRFSKPAGTAIAYMMSRHQVIYAGANGRRVGTWFPHLMFYMPNATRSTIAMPGPVNGDLMLADEGKATAHYVVKTRDWAVADPLPPGGASLSAQPSWVCAGDQYTIHWNGAQPSRLQRGDTIGELKNGLQFTALRTHPIAALDQSGKPVAHDTVTVHPDSMEHNFVWPSATCSGRLSLASFAIPPAVGSNRIKPRSVTNRGNMAVLVTHRGITVRLAPGESTDRFNDLPFTGDWGAVVETGDYNDFCPVPVAPAGSPAPGPPVDVLIVTSCAP